MTRDKLDSKIVKKMNGATLLALQMLPQPNYDVKNWKPHSILVIDSFYNYKKLDFADSTQAPKLSLEHNLKKARNIERIMQYFHKNPWAHITGNERGFSVILDE